jgi:hypothetical protein
MCDARNINHRHNLLVFATETSAGDRLGGLSRTSVALEDTVARLWPSLEAMVSQLRGRRGTP